MLLTRSTRFTCFFTAQTSIFQEMFVNFWGVFNVRNAKQTEFTIVSNFVAIFADFNEICSLIFFEEETRPRVETEGICSLILCLKSVEK